MTFNLHQRSPSSFEQRDRLLGLSISQLETLEAEVVHLTAIAELESWLQSHHV